MFSYESHAVTKESLPRLKCATPKETDQSTRLKALRLQNKRARNRSACTEKQRGAVPAYNREVMLLAKRPTLGRWIPAEE